MDEAGPTSDFSRLRFQLETTECQHILGHIDTGDGESLVGQGEEQPPGSASQLQDGSAELQREVDVRGYILGVGGDEVVNFSEEPGILGGGDFICQLDYPLTAESGACRAWTARAVPPLFLRTSPDFLRVCRGYLHVPGLQAIRGPAVVAGQVGEGRLFRDLSGRDSLGPGRIALNCPSWERSAGASPLAASAKKRCKRGWTRMKLGANQRLRLHWELFVRT